MTDDIDRQLARVLTQTAEQLPDHPDLWAGVRRAQQRQRRRCVATGAGLTAVVVAAIVVPLTVLPGPSHDAVLTATAPNAAGSPALPANSPLTGCVDPAPATPKPLDAPIAQNFAHSRVTTPLSLDGGAFRASPAPSDAAPKVSAALAMCNLLAGVTTNNTPVLDAAARNGLSFGLGVVTVADSVLRTGPRPYLVGGVQQTASLQPYHARLAWIAVIKPDVVASCPAETAPPPPASVTLPAYQILAIDADTGAAGIIYSAKTNAVCGGPGYQPARVAPAAESVSAPWTLISRGPGPQSATITYQARSCDKAEFAYFGETGKPTVFADRTDPSLVRVVLTRTLSTCGPAVTVPAPLRSATLTTNLPQHLTHAPVGAQDASD